MLLVTCGTHGLHEMALWSVVPSGAYHICSWTRLKGPRIFLFNLSPKNHNNSPWSIYKIGLLPNESYLFIQSSLTVINYMMFSLIITNYFGLINPMIGLWESFATLPAQKIMLKTGPSQKNVQLFILTFQHAGTLYICRYWQTICVWRQSEIL